MSNLVGHQVVEISPDSNKSSAATVSVPATPSGAEEPFILAVCHLTNFSVPATGGFVGIGICNYVQNGQTKVVTLAEGGVLLYLHARGITEVTFRITGGTDVIAAGVGLVFSGL